jgi:hypothetical protein
MNRAKAYDPYVEPVLADSIHVSRSLILRLVRPE